MDDEETLCEALCFNLEAEGYATGSAYSAEQALSMDLSAYDLVVLDVMMGEISGVQLARIMKSNPATSHVPILFCSARDSEDDVISGLDIGADDYVTKPFEMKEVLARIHAVLRRTGTEEETGEKKLSFDNWEDMYAAIGSVSYTHLRAHET